MLFLTKSLRNTLISVISSFLLKIIFNSAELFYLPSCDSSTLSEQFKVLQHQSLIIILLYLPIFLIIFYILEFFNRLATSEILWNWLTAFYCFWPRVNWTYFRIFVFNSQFFTTTISLFSFSIRTSFSLISKVFCFINLLIFLKFLFFRKGS